MTPTDEDFDDMHHALGRPDGPHVEPYRNRYVVGIDSPTAERFLALGLWRLDCKINHGRDGVFSVTPDGYWACMRWLLAKQRADGLRRWTVSGEGFADRQILAKSRSAARAHVWRQRADCWDISFREFLRLGVAVRSA